MCNHLFLQSIVSWILAIRDKEDERKEREQDAGGGAVDKIKEVYIYIFC